MRASTVFALALLLGSCEWILDHSLRPVPEESDALCRDGRDNDFNGLTDCQDWGCLDQLTCCTLQDVVLVDAFDGPACTDLGCDVQSCDVPRCGPDTNVWHTWPCPYPVVCNGALRPIKKFPTCYAAGVLSRRSVPIGPGLAVTVELQGEPERQGYLEAAFTVRDELSLPGHSDPCSGLQSVGGFVALKYIWSAEGARVVALAQGEEIGRSEPLFGTTHIGEIVVTADRRVEFRIDGTVFATGAPVPETPQQARVALTGISESSMFSAVQLRAGARCHDPKAWVLSGADVASSQVIGVDPGTPAWDSDEVHSPSVREVAGTIELYYTGCRWSEGTLAGCGERSSQIGRTIADASGVWIRNPDPVLPYFEIPRASAGALISVEVLPDGNGFVAAGKSVLPIEVADSIVVIDSDVLTESAFFNHAFGGLASVHLPDGRTFVWISTTSRTGDSAIELAVSSDGRNFTRHPTPVIQPGAPADFDSEGVLDPEVIYDADRRLFLMWYQGRDFYGNIAIGQAASTDGVHWSKAPQNPIIDHTIGLTTFGRPSVLSRSDGRSRMFVDGSPPGTSRRSIYSLENAGTQNDRSPPMAP